MWLRGSHGCRRRPGAQESPAALPALGETRRGDHRHRTGATHRAAPVDRGSRASRDSGCTAGLPRGARAGDAAQWPPSQTHRAREEPRAIRGERGRRGPSLIYLDTSALVKRFVIERGSTALDRLVRREDVVATATIAYAERMRVSRAAAGMGRSRRPATPARAGTSSATGAVFSAWS